MKCRDGSYSDRGAIGVVALYCNTVRILFNVEWCIRQLVFFYRVPQYH